MSDVAVSISTRNRGADVCRTMDTILASDHPRFDVVIVDQRR